MTEGDLRALGEQALKEIAGAVDVDQLELVRLKYLARHGGLISAGAQDLAKAPPELRAGLGRAFNATKQGTEAALERRLAEFQLAQRQAAVSPQSLDLSYPSQPLPRGHQHPVGRLVREIEDIGAALGYQSVRGPEVEDDQYNFELLNLPPEHPARDSHDTFYLEGPARGWLLRTHTSPVQLRTMMAGPPPYRILAPGRAYRRDNPDPTHNPMFFQVEGLCVDQGVTLGDLKGTLTYFIQALFGAARRVRLRSSFFAFTEPSLEADVSCWFCDGRGCRSCHGKGWIEILGSGMVHPSVLQNAGVDPQRFSGFAFGMGPDRIAALKYGLADIRDLYENDLRLLEYF
ncbi:MAG TPA: phenylalanine--tRNA ligase subunit alpha [Candidatus Dormibacteraeota bacterium]|nr:phenylalanine--tRNA ligase subunit alpha [Candidatus Dormibacteraeota bacterium]